jgi:nucleoside phosphorylase
METLSALARDKYAVGWICALPVEMASSQALLDERHPILKQNPNDHNSYTLGRIGVHNVIMTCLPGGGTGTVSAAIVATEMVSRFRNLQFVLLVGVGGGVPGVGSDIRLGDVVVSHPGPNHGGVVQFDFGKTMQDGRFVPNNMLDRPPRFLLAAVSTVRSNHARGDSVLSGYLQQIYDHHPLMKTRYAHPGVEKDVLYESQYDHPQREATCSCCDSARILSRTPRQSNDPVIHYGLIASGNQVMRHGMTRDRLRDEMGMACFEMEAAGLMGQFPCLVIRGISDYADSHKNKLWQPYASAVAASYAKELLDIIPSSTDAHPHVRTNTFGSESTEWRGKQYENGQDDGRKYEPLESPEDFSNSLPGLVSRFQGCIQSFPELLLPPDAPLPFRLTWEKLELEKVLLLQWADRVHLLDDWEYSPLRDIETRKTIGAVLHDLQSMLDDKASNEVSGLVPLHKFERTRQRHMSWSESLDTNAGTPIYSEGGFAGVAKLQSHNRQQQKISSQVEHVFLSRKRLEKFKENYHSYQKKLKTFKENYYHYQKGNPKPQAPSTHLGWMSSKWVLSDAGHYQTRLNDLAELVQRLDNVVPVEYLTKLRLAEEDINPNWPTDLLVYIQRAAYSRSNAFVETIDLELKKRCEQKILRRLSFQEMNTRKDSITSPFVDTLGWALSTKATTERWDLLPLWFQSGSGIYWLCGKAGSGKSTLMKLLSDHEATLEYLSTWTKGKPCDIAEFFIWKLGTKEQNSLYGLFRSILHQVLSLHPSLCQELLPRVWEQAYGHDAIDFALPGPEEVLGLCNSIRDHPKVSRMCLFIDGLDEFSGNIFEGIELIETLTSGSKIKAVVSSRPEHKLVAAFHKCPQLKLEDLSRSDIARYIQSKLKSPLYEYGRYSSDPDGAEPLIREMVDKASGVFLWVVLACRSLLDGLAASDSPSELRKRIDELPEKLEDLFRDMLTRVDKRYLLQAARILKVCKLYIAQYGIGVPTLGLAQLDWHDYDSSRLAEALKYGFSIIEKDANCNRIEGRLRSRCGGLLELRRSNRLPQRFCFCGQFNFGGYNTCHEGFDADSVIIFMHRSVFDFLDMEQTWELDCLDLGAEHEFDAQAAVGCLSLHLAHCSANQNNNSHSPSQCIEHIYDAWRRVLWANWKTGTQIIHVVAALVDVLRMAQSARRWASDYPWGDFPPEKIILRLAVEAGMLDLIERFRDKNAGFDTLEGCYPLLFHATNPMYSNYILSEEHSKTALCDVPLFDRVKPAHHVVRWLLSLGYCPNEEFTAENKEKTTPWKYWVARLESSRSLNLRQLRAQASVTIEYLNMARASLPMLDAVLNWQKRCVLYCTTSEESSMRLQFEEQLQTMLELLEKRRTWSLGNMLHSIKDKRI